ncbi:hypothetical protein FVB32_13790 [Flagellimonas hymeniacidonis]|uniref:Outer membrane protein beta-barrel domain-containing protein n=1 Tax=Flagellimonas hymeniacidonis TaxID=2603628 RepID=A0A5C8V2P7_9FLAO|nr:DUF3575 domain-containing protein [Flagellimonas hymeniacidonis]TXN35646.1 hypothetical protein FVB32_13790 [Flagellimonas hymeniacidonis]
MPKKNLALLLVLSCFFLSNAQEKNNVKLNIAPGLLLKTNSENLGLLLNVEPSIEISTRSVIGLRFGLAVNPQKFENNGNSQFRFDTEKDNGILSFVPTYTYYLNEKYTRPYVGMGLGYYVFSSIDLVNPSENVPEGSVNNQAGFLIRGGIEWRKTKLGLEYNFVSKADVTIPNGQTVGTVDNSYLGISIGFTIGGGSNGI